MFSLLLSACSARANFYVMAPLDVLDNNQYINNMQTLGKWLDKLKNAGVDGIMCDVWWGLCEHRPNVYNFKGYANLFKMFQERGLKIIPVLSFHQCGGNVGDTCNIPLPRFVQDCKPFWKDADGHLDNEYISIAYDNVELNGRTPIKMYSQFMDAFRKEFAGLINSKVISEVEVGLGPAGELRYPSYQLAYWNYPGCGEFQAYDDKFKAHLKKDAERDGKSNFGHPPARSETGDYNVRAGGAQFWRNGAANAWDSEYGQYFIKWYHNQLVNHGEAVLKEARRVFGSFPLSGKVAGIHWWYDTESHCAETTAGFNNFQFYNGYNDICKMFKKLDIDICFTCLEMAKTQNDCGSNPPELVNLVLNSAMRSGIKFEGENALPIYDRENYNRVLQWAKKGLSCFTYLRLCPDLVENENHYQIFKEFVANIHRA